MSAPAADGLIKRIKKLLLIIFSFFMMIVISSFSLAKVSLIQISYIGRRFSEAEGILRLERRHSRRISGS
jgi:hypothetical protein